MCLGFHVQMPHFMQFLVVQALEVNLDTIRICSQMVFGWQAEQGIRDRQWHSSSHVTQRNNLPKMLNHSLKQRVCQFDFFFLIYIKLQSK